MIYDYIPLILYCSSETGALARREGDVKVAETGPQAGSPQTVDQGNLPTQSEKGEGSDSQKKPGPVTGKTAAEAKAERIKANADRIRNRKQQMAFQDQQFRAQENTGQPRRSGLGPYPPGSPAVTSLAGSREFKRRILYPSKKY